MFKLEFSHQNDNFGDREGSIPTIVPLQVTIGLPINPLPTMLLVNGQTNPDAIMTYTHHVCKPGTNVSEAAEECHCYCDCSYTVHA